MEWALVLVIAYLVHRSLESQRKEREAQRELEEQADRFARQLEQELRDAFKQDPENYA